MDFLDKNSSLRLAFLLRVDGPLLDPFGKGILVHPGVQGEGEGGANGNLELESLALTCQCSTEVQALGGQGGFSLTDCGHFCCFLLKNPILNWSQKVNHVSPAVLPT